MTPTRLLPPLLGDSCYGHRAAASDRILGPRCMVYMIGCDNASGMRIPFNFVNVYVRNL